MIGDSNVVTLTSGVEVCILKTFSYFKCKNKGCKASDLIWARTKNNKAIPVHWVDGEGWVCHFADCPGSRRFKGKRIRKLKVKGGK